jgi:alpha-D-ribose 1-methylphosphonate 5-triphosphate diphosphatase
MTVRTFTNARIITASEDISRGSMVIDGAAITEVAEAASALASAVDLDGDLLLPGFVELHTDNVERHTSPRPGVQWPMSSAVLAHDSEMSAAGFTTVLDSVRIGDIFKRAAFDGISHSLLETIRRLGACGVTRAEHFVHLRCEICQEQTVEIFENLADHPLVRLVSLMDHTPGQRQYTDPDRLRLYYRKKHGMTDHEFDRFAKEQQAAHERLGGPHRRAIAERTRLEGHVLASHDDATLAHVDEAIADGVRVAEFPTTLEAAAASHEAGMAVLVGGPNLVLGGSHAGNIAAIDLARAGVVDVISSDYVPMSVLHGAFQLARSDIGLDLPAAIRTASLNPANAVGLVDRGALEPGKRADFLRVTLAHGVPFIREVWRGGERVA